MIPLAGPEATVLRRLTQVIAMGKHARSYTARDVVRVAVERLPAGEVYRRAIARERAARLRAEREAEALRAQLAHPQHAPHRVAEVTRLQKVILDHAARGRKLKDIADDFAMKPSAVQAHLARAADRMDADSTGHALALINRGVVVLRVKGQAA